MFKSRSLTFKLCYPGQDKTAHLPPLGQQDGINLLAISVDGIPESHNRLRASSRAFETMVVRLSLLRDARIPFGFIFTLTQFNLNELAWVAKFAVEEGAQLLQIHPLEEVGRAAEVLSGENPDETERSFAFIEIHRLKAVWAGRLDIQLDLVHRDTLSSNPDTVFAHDINENEMSHMSLAAIVNPLVIEPDGTVVPLQYGLSRQYALGNLHAAPLRALATAWRQDGYHQFRAMCQRAFMQATTPTSLPIVNWYDALGAKHGDYIAFHVAQHFDPILYWLVVTPLS